MKSTLLFLVLVIHAFAVDKFTPLNMDRQSGGNSLVVCDVANKYYLYSNQFRRDPYLYYNVQSYNTINRNVTIKNTGENIQERVEFYPNSVMNICVNRSSVPYVLFNVHIHIENGDARHYINGVNNPGEIHFDHYKKEYGNESEAQKHLDGIMNLSVILKLTKSDNPSLTPIVEVLSQIHTKNSSASIKSFNFATILPRHNLLVNTKNRCKLYVNAKVFAEPLNIGVAQFSKFKALLDKSGLNRTLNDNLGEDLGQPNGPTFTSSPAMTYELIH